MNITLENKFEKVSRTLISIILASMITYSLYNVLSYRTYTYSRPIENVSTIVLMEDSSALR